MKAPCLPHESPGVMTIPLVILSFFAVLLGFVGTPAWPWFQQFLKGGTATTDFHHLFSAETLRLMGLSSVVALGGMGAGWWFYGRRPLTAADDLDTVEHLRPDIYGLLRNKYYIDEIYEVTALRLNASWSRACNWLEFWLWCKDQEFVGNKFVQVSKIEIESYMDKMTMPEPAHSVYQRMKDTPPLVSQGPTLRDELEKMNG